MTQALTEDIRFSRSETTTGAVGVSVGLRFQESRDNLCMSHHSSDLSVMHLLMHG